MLRDWKEVWIDQMGLIVALSGEERYARLRDFKKQLALLSDKDFHALNKAIKERFTPSNGEDGCQSATEAVKEACKC